MVWHEDSMKQLVGCLEHLHTGALSMVASVRGTENNHRGINQGSRADDVARTLVFGLKILVQQLTGEPVHCREEETNCLCIYLRLSSENTLLRVLCVCCNLCRCYTHDTGRS